MESAADTLGDAERVGGAMEQTERNEGPETEIRPRTVPEQDLGK